MKKQIVLGTALLIAAFIGGCILASGTKVINFDLQGSWHPVAGMQSQYVDLPNQNSDYDKNKDKIKSVDSAVLVGTLVNHGSSSVQSNIYISDNQYTTPAQVETPGNATLIFVSPTVPANDSLRLNWSDGLSHIQNFDILQNKLKTSGQFYVYAITTNGGVIDYNLSIVITLTVGM
jgi:hypothetical protein